jgi:hypothetical protein
MAFPIDTSHSFQRPGQLKALVRAAADAGEHEEHNWIEWEIGLDQTPPAAISRRQAGTRPATGSTPSVSGAPCSIVERVGVVNAARNLTPCRRLKVDPLTA